jgi:hypothetical protein
MLWAEALALSLLLLARCRELFERKAISAVEPAGMRDLNEGQKIAYEIVADSAAANSRPTI